MDMARLQLFMSNESGAYDEIQWGKYGDNGLAIYINSNGYLWDINKNLGRACLPCDSIPSFNSETQS